MFYLDPNYNYHWLESAPSYNKYLIEQYLTKFNEVQEDETLDPEQKANAIASLLNGIARLAGIDPELLYADMGGVIEAIAAVNYSVKKAVDEAVPNSSDDDEKQEELNVDDNEIVSLQEYHYQLVVSLVNTELAVDLESALKIAAETPCEHVEGYIAARIKFLNHDKIVEEKKAKETAKETAELERIVDQQMADGTFYDGLLDPATAGKVPIDLSVFNS